jgi:pimeloyl-ACP methyl ester carboxylesterase
MIENTAITTDHVTIEYYCNSANSDKTPVIISRGNWEPAFRAFPLMEYIKDRTVYALSYRGRGKSSSPESGYDWIDHIKDIKAVVEKNKINKAYFVAFSKGVSYTLAFLEQCPEIVKGLILVDYPAIHEAAFHGYADFFYTRQCLTYNIKDYISRKALEGIEREATDKDFYPLISKLKCPIMVFIGIKKDSTIESAISIEEVTRYKEANKNVQIVEFLNSGHMIFDEEPEKVHTIIVEFLKNNDLTTASS